VKVTLGATTLADDTATPRLAGVIEQLGGQAVVQVEPLYGQADMAVFPRGNISGRFVFRVFCSYASYATALTAWAAAYARLNTQDTLVLTWFTGNTLTMLGAVCTNVERTKLDGVGLEVRYTFTITTATDP